MSAKDEEGRKIIEQIVEAMKANGHDAGGTKINASGKFMYVLPVTHDGVLKLPL